MSNVLVISADTIPIKDHLAAGTGIRSWEIARGLRKYRHDVTIAVPKERYNSDIEEYSGVKIKPWDYNNLISLCNGMDAAFLPQGLAALSEFFVKHIRNDLCVIVDVYDPNFIESLNIFPPNENGIKEFSEYLTRIVPLLKRGDFFVCASGRQRYYYLGVLNALGRINPLTYDQRLIEIIPFGVPDEDPFYEERNHVMRGILVNEEDLVVLWFGGIYPWFDAITLIKAIDIAVKKNPKIKLVIMGAVHPSGHAPQDNYIKTLELSKQLDLNNKYVFFTEWRPYDERIYWYREADIGICTFPVHLETELSNRTRVMDMLWGGLPIITTEGDELSALIKQYNCGETVKSNDPDQLAEVLLDLLGNNEKRKKLAENSKRFAERFRWKNVVKPLAEFLNNPVIARDRKDEFTANTLLWFVDTLERHRAYMPTENLLLNEEIKKKDQKITELDQKNKLLSQQNELVNQQNNLMNLKLNSVYGSFTWRTLMKFQKLIDIIFPGNTRRRRCYDIGLMAIRTISNEGWSAFYNQSLRFLQKKNDATKISRVPILAIKAPFISPLSLEKKICGVFQSNIDQLTEIRIITATYQRKNADISFILRSENGDALQRVKIPGRKIQDNAYTSFKFKPINDSKGKKFYFEIKSTGKPSAAVWYDPDQISTNIDIYCDEKKLQGSINFQAFSSVKNKDLYEIWISCFEPNEVELEQQRNDSKEFHYRPLISIITPVYNTTPNILKETIQSVLKQTYDNWELCIVDGNSKGEELKNILTDFSQIDERIHINFLDQNLGISGNSNKALQIAKGEFISLLDHDDLLAPFALFEMVKTLNKEPELDFIYSDKDIISEDGKQRLEPLFKPDWSPEIMLSANYLTHLCVIRKNLVDKMGGFLSDTDGAQDWDLFMRVTENTNKIHHISRVLYHWRESETSCALWCSAAKPYIFDAQRNVLHNHLKRLGKSVELTLIPPGIWRIKWTIKEEAKISIIIPTKDNIMKLRPCVESILNKSSYQNFEIIIIDTGSKELESLKYYDKISIDQKIKIINYNQPFNYSAVNNLGEKHATGEILLFLNDDTEVITSDWLEEMAGWIQQEEIGIVGAKLLKPDNTIQHAGVILGMQGFAGHPFAGAKDNFNGPFGSTEWYRDYLAITGACMMVRKKVFEEAGGFNESFILMGSDVELCLRIWKNGYRIVFTPFAKLVHHEASTRSKYIPPQDFIISYEYYESFLKNGDPYYNKNLSLWKTIPSIRMLGEKEASEFVQDVLKSVSKK